MFCRWHPFGYAQDRLYNPFDGLSVERTPVIFGVAIREDRILKLAE
jgi:hypothetical protein